MRKQTTQPTTRRSFSELKLELNRLDTASTDTESCHSGLTDRVFGDLEQIEEACTTKEDLIRARIEARYGISRYSPDIDPRCVDVEIKDSEMRPKRARPISPVVPDLEMYER
jgi:hypothetical protein